jgi:hypothetical protein
MAGHMLGQTEDLHLLTDSSFDNILQGVLGMARAELARMAVMREWHGLWICHCDWLAQYPK